jgi:hypothetical protein
MKEACCVCFIQTFAGRMFSVENVSKKFVLIKVFIIITVDIVRRVVVLDLGNNLLK